ncbi:glycosyltransferase N-terminal domain-containing protein [uncultured Dokdonia sp.]|uniref:3-deoxy-D-manno-octulosonic acid transferase n=1 Tax=uncultured Dokdonia sp. TaxID=575653 RepID=UPI00260CE18D|nr:glycosyltransferase N-terminal domain-containing protein [uncultured Dokdonia sp.]
MRRLYSIIISIVQAILPISGLFSSKMKLFVSGRKDVFSILREQITDQDRIIWFHAASLGEYEQGVPVMEEIIKHYPEYKLVITFFSPSGYEVKKNNAFAKATTYLPLDTPANARTFIDLIHPELVFFIKYEFWPNYLTELKKRNIRTVLLSGVFRENQPFFKWYGKWMLKSLDAFDHFFVQDNASLIAAEALNLQPVTVSGDTRFDRVSRQIEMDNTLEFISAFKADQLCVVCGSTWPEDEEVFASFINRHQGMAKFIIAPHQIKPEKIVALRQKLKVKTVLFSEKEGKMLSEYDVFIINTIGLLTKIYSYADVAYIGGALGTTGLHNILEPATFGIPIAIGNHFEKFPEAKRLQQLAGLYTISNQKELDEILHKLLSDQKFRMQTGMIAGHFINSNTGATKTVMKYIASLHG